MSYISEPGPLAAIPTGRLAALLAAALDARLGLGGMTGRAALVGATLTIESARDSGTHILLDLGGHK